MQAQIDALAREGDTFEFEPEPLFERRVETQLNFSSSAQHALPWERVRRVIAQEPRNGSMVERISGCSGDLSVAGHLALRDGANHFTESLVTNFVGAEAVA